MTFSRWGLKAPKSNRARASIQACCAADATRASSATKSAGTRRALSNSRAVTRRAEAVGIGVEVREPCAQVVEQRAHLVRRELLVLDLVERGHLGAADSATARGHHHGLVPEQDLLRPAQVVDLGQA